LEEHFPFSYGTKEKNEKNYVRLSNEAGVESSAVREILAIMQGNKNIISLAGGVPDTSLFATQQFKEIFLDCMDGKCADLKGEKIVPGTLLQYSPTAGVGYFVDSLLNWIEKNEDFGQANKENILVVSAAQQALDISAKAFIDPCKDNVVITGDPTYLAELNILAGRSRNLEVIGIPLDDNGMQVDLIHDIPKEKLAKAKYIYVVPTFDNPAGTELSEKRRKQLIDVSNEYGIPIIEDEPYSCMRYEGKKLHSLKHFDDINCVLRLQTFSKMAAPGIRLGYVLGPEAMVAKLNVILQNAALCASAMSQFLMAEFINRGYMQDYWNKIVPVYKERRDAMTKSMDEQISPYGSWVKPKGGMFVWLKLNDLNGDDLFKAALKKDVAIVKGSAFFTPNADKELHKSARLNFSKSKPELLKTGIERLSLACKELSEGKK